MRIEFGHQTVPNVIILLNSFIGRVSGTCVLHLSRGFQILLIFSLVHCWVKYPLLTTVKAKKVSPAVVGFHPGEKMIIWLSVKSVKRLDSEPVAAL